MNEPNMTLLAAFIVLVLSRDQDRAVNPNPVTAIMREVRVPERPIE
jgi:hypothetical protein